MAIRAALGATRHELMTSVMRQGLTPVVFGVLVGLAAVFAGASLLQQFLFETSPRFPPLYGGVAAFVGLVGVIATLIPARAARTTSPTVAMRAE
jgi:ABC-type antimicrobial peptide transport system permease subunit